MRALLAVLSTMGHRNNVEYPSRPNVENKTFRPNVEKKWRLERFGLTWNVPSVLTWKIPVRPNVECPIRPNVECPIRPNVENPHSA